MKELVYRSEFLPVAGVLGFLAQVDADRREREEGPRRRMRTIVAERAAALAAGEAYWSAFWGYVSDGTNRPEPERPDCGTCGR